MTVREEHRAALRALDGDPAAVRAHLTAGSACPGPGRTSSSSARSPTSRPPTSCAPWPTTPTSTSGAADVRAGPARRRGPADARAEPTDRLRARASDGSWRVREAAAMALQRIGDAEPATLRALVASWVADPDPLVRRAAVAGVCEPRLLRDPATATAALDACAAATASIGALPVDARRAPTCARCARPSGTAGASPSSATRPPVCRGSRRCAGRRTRTWRGSCARTRRRPVCAACSTARRDRAARDRPGDGGTEVVLEGPCVACRTLICLTEILIGDEGVR